MATLKMDSSPSIHVLNTENGVPASRMALSLHRLDPKMVVWNLITIGTTTEDGHCSELISSQDFTVGMYKIRFETGQYWESLGQTTFYPYIEIVFTLSDLDQKFNLSLLLNRLSYSTYRSK